MDVQILVGDTGAKTAELFIAPSECRLSDGLTLCSTGVTWYPTTASNPPSKGPIYLLESDRRSLVDIGADGVANFHLEADRATFLTRLVVVGFDDAGNEVALGDAHDVTVTANTPQVWQIQLEPTTSLFSAPPGPGEPTRQVHTWRTPTDETNTSGLLLAKDIASCLALQTWHGDGTTTLEYFVPPTNRDCDPYLPSGMDECRQYLFDYDSRGVGANCVTDSSSNVPSGVCALGSSACADGVPGLSSSTCRELTGPTTCFPSRVCNQCKDDKFMGTCIATQALGTGAMIDSNVPSLYCRYPETSVHKPCNQTAIANIGTLQLASTLFGASEFCDEASWWDLSAPPVVQANPWIVGGTGGAELQLHVESTFPPCTVTIAWGDGFRNPMITTVRAFVAFHVMPTDRRVMIPIQIDWDTLGAGCPGTPQNPCDSGMSLQGDSVLTCF